MPTYSKCPKEVNDLASSILCQHPCYTPLLDARVRIDFLFAYGDYDEATGRCLAPAIKHAGVRALGLCRKMSLKDRAMGRGDAEICLDGDEFGKMSEAQKIAILDHELYHIMVKCNSAGVAQTDDLNRPIINMRPHDWQFGFFNVIAERNGDASFERQYARQMIEQGGQYLFPEFMSHLANA